MREPEVVKLKGEVGRTIFVEFTVSLFCKIITFKFGRTCAQESSHYVTAVSAN